MKIEIGAMSAGDILDRGLKLLMARLATFYAINLIVLSPIIIYVLIVPPLLMQGGGGAGFANLAALLGGTVAMVLLAIILQPIGAAAILHVISQDFIDKRVGMGQALNFAMGRFLPLLGTSILTGLVIALGAALCLVPGVIFWVWFIFIAQVVVLEGKGGVNAMNRSKDLTSGFRWRVFGLLLLFIVIGLIAGLTSNLLGLFLPSVELIPTDPAAGRLGQFTTVFNYRNYAIDTLISQLLNILVGSFQAVCMTLLYFDLRIRKEGFDLELAARQQTPTTP